MLTSTLTRDEWSIYYKVNEKMALKKVGSNIIALMAKLCIRYM